MRVGRNQTCPCGSGKKFKSCCEGKKAFRQSRGMLLLLGAIGLVAAVGVVPALLPEKNEAEAPIVAPASANAGAARPGSPQPPGPAPAGKVWSVEHGHWHDVPAASPVQMTPIQTSAGNLTPTVTTPSPQAPVAQPAGQAPPGKVWSAEHGHWHDVPAQ